MGAITYFIVTNRQQRRTGTRRNARTGESGENCSFAHQAAYMDGQQTCGVLSGFEIVERVRNSLTGTHIWINSRTYLRTLTRIYCMGIVRRKFGKGVWRWAATSEKLMGLGLHPVPVYTAFLLNNGLRRCTRGGIARTL